MFTQDVSVRDKISPYLTLSKFALVNTSFELDLRISTHLFSPAFEVSSGSGLSFIPC